MNARRATSRVFAAVLLAAKLDLSYFRAHPFTGTCPTAYGSESIYRFRGVSRSLPSCTYDLGGVEAVQLADRLLGTLRPAHR